MLETLKFVRGAVAKKDYSPALTHFKISGGRITGQNGRIAISSPIALDIEATPRAEPFIKAIETCEQEAALTVTDKNKLAIKSGKFKAFIDCTTEPFPEVKPAGVKIPVRKHFLEALRALEAFTSNDASRRWSMGVLFKGESAYATNNVIAVEYWLGAAVPHTLVIPATTVAELIRIGASPVCMQVAEQAATFHFDGDRWLHTQLYEVGWPDIKRLLDRESDQQPVPAGLFEALHAIEPFSDEQGRVYLQPGLVGTTPDKGEGASIEVEGLAQWGCYNLTQLLLLEKVATTIDLSNYPAPAIFFGDKLRGAIAPLRG